MLSAKVQQNRKAKAAERFFYVPSTARFLCSSISFELNSIASYALSYIAREPQGAFVAERFFYV
jgi:hypothetical protein